MTAEDSENCFRKGATHHMNSMQTCNSVMFYFMEKLIYPIIAVSAFYQIWLLFMKQNVTEFQVCMGFMISKSWNGPHCKAYQNRPHIKQQWSDTYISEKVVKKWIWNQFLHFILYS